MQHCFVLKLSILPENRYSTTSIMVQTRLNFLFSEFSLFVHHTFHLLYFCVTALTINLGPTFLSGALAAQAEVTPRTPSCPLVRGPARHAVLNALWAAVNLLCIGLAVNHLRKLKKDLGTLLKFTNVWFPI